MHCAAQRSRVLHAEVGGVARRVREPLAGNVDAVGDKQAIHHFSGGSGLYCDEFISQHAAGDFVDDMERVRLGDRNYLYATKVFPVEFNFFICTIIVNDPLAAATGVDLGFYDKKGAPFFNRIVRRLDSLLRSEGRSPLLDRDSVPAEKFFGLMLVNVHSLIW